MKAKLDSIRQELIEKYNTKFVTNYVELEYSAKLVPDGKRCRMKKPYHRNILFVGDAAGRGIFIGPRIEGLNVGIDDAVRASLAISRSIDKNNFAEDYMGQYYTSLVEQSPYTRDMKEIDKEYLKIFLESTKSIPKEIVGSRYGFIFKIMSSGKLRGLAVGIAESLGIRKDPAASGIGGNLCTGAHRVGFETRQKTFIFLHPGTTFGRRKSCQVKV